MSHYTCKRCGQRYSDCTCGPSEPLTAAEKEVIGPSKKKASSKVKLPVQDSDAALSKVGLAIQNADTALGMKRAKELNALFNGPFVYKVESLGEERAVLTSSSSGTDLVIEYGPDGLTYKLRRVVTKVDVVWKA